jgi:CRISPR/Cas system CMR-associated protein Cmr5 small subunit
MALNDIVFVKGQGGLGRPLTGEDFISGLVFYTANGNLPSGWTTTNRVKLIGSVQDAENAGIKSDYSDATAATGTYLITTKGNTGDTIVLKYTDAAGVVLDLGLYTVLAADSSILLQGAAWAAVINAGTITHGCTASFNTATLTITLPKSQGVYPNAGTPFAVTLTGAFAGTLTQNVVAGLASNQALWHYHISEYFRIQPKGSLYVGYFPVPATYTFAEIQTMQVFSNGKIRQIAVYKDSVAFASGDLTAIQAVCSVLDTLHMPVSSVLYGANIKAVADLSTLADLGTLSASKASAVISQDAAGLGAFLYITHGHSITTIGALLGAVSFAKVSEDIAWPNKFNISSGFECDTIGFANGALISSVSQSLLNTLDDRRYIFLIKYVGIAGSYFNDSHTSIAVTSDYAYIENNRTIDKAIRGVYADLISYINSPLVLNADGTLKDTTIAFFESQAGNNLDQMVRDSELSAYEVSINPAQNVLSTNNITVAVKLVPIGVARQITVNIGFTTSI